MLWYERVARACALGVASLMLTLAGCSFQPLYGDGAPASARVRTVLSATRVAPLADREGQLLRYRLDELLHPESAAGERAWVLNVALETERRDFSIRLDETTSRARVRFRALWRLQRTGEGEGETFAPFDALYTGEVSSGVAYDIVRSALATQTARRAARDAALAELAERIVESLALTLRAPERGS